MNERRVISLPLSPDDTWATIEAPWPLTTAQWEQMLHLLTTMRPALVAEPPAQPAEHAGDGP